MRWYVLEVNPEPWAIGPVGTARRGGKVTSYVGRNQQLDAYKEAVKEALGEQALIEGKVELKFFFWRNRAEYTTPQAKLHRKHEADLTNLQKATEDALQGVLFTNDRDVQHIESYIVEQGPEVEGRVVIGIDSAEPAFNPDVVPDFVWHLLDHEPLFPEQATGGGWNPGEEMF